MENYFLYIEPERINRVNGKFLKGHIPWNKGKKWAEYMDMRKAKRVKKCLEIGRKLGNAKFMHDFNCKEIVGIKDGKLVSYKSAVEAEKILRSQGIKISARNISTICHQKVRKFRQGKYIYNYVRKKAGGFRWFFARDIEKYKIILDNDKN